MSSHSLSYAELTQRFNALEQFLVAQQAFWGERPFNHLQLAWESQAPELSAWLRQQDLAHAERYQANPEQLTQAPEPYRSLAARSLELTKLESSVQNQQLVTRPAYLSRDVPGRKWQQIQAFAQALTANSQLTWLDWCAGKGHLSRYLAWPNQAYSCLEYDPDLVSSGQQLTDKLQLNGQHFCQDVMQPEAANHLTNSYPVALHACGDLHRQLIKVAADAKVEQLALAPCCYNRTLANHYQPLSQLAQASKLALSKSDLALPLQATVTANQRETQQRNQSMAWRLGFDSWQRIASGNNQYLATPSLPSSWWKKDFSQWCQDLADLKQVRYSANQDWASFEALGWQRLAIVRNLELVQGLFKRPLELWLVLDLALYLAEQGYQMQLNEFCEQQLTPRNILLQARLQA